VEGIEGGNAALACMGCGNVHDNAKLVTLPDGRQVGNHSEQYRLYCEATWAMRLPDSVGPRSKRWTKRRYLLEVQRVRGERAAEQLRAVMLKLWKERNGQTSDAGAHSVAKGKAAPAGRR
jgi:hypothetical protein